MPLALEEADAGIDAQPQTETHMPAGLGLADQPGQQGVGAAGHGPLPPEGEHVESRGQGGVIAHGKGLKAVVLPVAGGPELHVGMGAHIAFQMAEDVHRAGLERLAAQKVLHQRGVIRLPGLAHHLHLAQGAALHVAQLLPRQGAVLAQQGQLKIPVGIRRARAGILRGTRGAHRGQDGDLAHLRQGKGRIHSGIHTQLHALRRGGLGALAHAHGLQTGGGIRGLLHSGGGRFQIRPSGKGLQHGRVVGHQYQMPFQQIGGKTGAGERTGTGHGRHIVQQLFRDHGLGREMLQSL